MRALALMEAEAPQRFPLECGILLHNRAEAALAPSSSRSARSTDLTLLLRFEPSSSEAYFDRGLLQQRAGPACGGAGGLRRAPPLEPALLGAAFQPRQVIWRWPTATRPARL
jgi:hypothetical protein